MDLIVCFIIPKQTSRRIYGQEIKPVSWEAEPSLCVCFLPTLQLIFNRTRAESFTLLLHSLAILISHRHLCPLLSSNPFALAHFVWLLLPFCITFCSRRVWGGSAVKSRWMFISLPLPTCAAAQWCVQCLVKNCKSLIAERDYYMFRFIPSKDDRDELPPWD